MYVCEANELLNPLKYISYISDEAIFHINKPDHSNEWYIVFKDIGNTIAGYGKLKDSFFTRYDYSEREIGLDIARFSKFLPVYEKSTIAIEFTNDKIKLYNYETYGSKLEYKQSLVNIDIISKPPDFKNMDDRFLHPTEFDLRANVSTIKKEVSKHKKDANYLIFYNDPDNNASGLKIIDLAGNVIIEIPLLPMAEYYPPALCVLKLDLFYKFFYKVPALGKNISVIFSLLGTGYWGEVGTHYSDIARLKIEFDPYSNASVTTFIAPASVDEEVLVTAGLAHLMPEKPTKEEIEIKEEEKAEEDIKEYAIARVKHLLEHPCSIESIKKVLGPAHKKYVNEIIEEIKPAHLPLTDVYTTAKLPPEDLVLEATFKHYPGGIGCGKHIVADDVRSHGYGIAAAAAVIDEMVKKGIFRKVGPVSFDVSEEYRKPPEEEKPQFDEADTVTYTTKEGKSIGIGMVYDFSRGEKGRLRLDINFPMVADDKTDTMTVWSDDPGLRLIKKSTDKDKDIREWYANWEKLSKELKEKVKEKMPEETLEERVLRELRTKYRFSRPEGDKVRVAIDNYLQQRNKKYVEAILAPVRDGKYVAEDLISMIEEEEAKIEKVEEEKIIEPKPIMEKEPWEMTQKEFVDAYYDSYERKKLDEEKTEITKSLKDTKRAYEEAVKAGKPVVAAREERYREFLETRLEANLKGTFTDPESAHQVILTQLHEDHGGFIRKALGEKKPVPSQIREEWPYLISSIRLKESLKMCISTMREAVEKHSTSPLDRLGEEWKEFTDILICWEDLGIEEQKELCHTMFLLVKDENRGILSKAMLITIGGFGDVYKKCGALGLLKEMPMPAPTPKVPPKVVEKKKPEVKPAIPIPIKASDIDYNLAVSAYSGTSFSPEKRAEEEQQAYLNHIEGLYNELLPYAKTDAQKRVLESKLTSYASEYAKRQNDILSSRSQIISPMIAGPSKFPTERMRKLNAALDKKEHKFIEWQKRTIGSIKKSLKQVTVEEKGGEVAVLEEETKKLEHSLQQMKELNKIVRKKGLTDEQKLDLLLKLGINEESAKKALSPEFTGVPDYTLTSIRNRIKTRKARIEELKAKEAKKGYKVTKEFIGGQIIKNYDIDRVQIVFDDIPSAEVRTELKSHGWHWSPSNEAWQRKITGDAEYSANDIIGKFYKIEEAAPPTPTPKVPPKPEKKKELWEMSRNEFDSSLTLGQTIPIAYEGVATPFILNTVTIRSGINTITGELFQPVVDFQPYSGVESVRIVNITEGSRSIETLRRQVIARAIAERKTVPKEVLDDYPELKEKAKEKPPEKRMPKEKTIATEKGIIETFEVHPIEKWYLVCEKVGGSLEYFIEGCRGIKNFGTFDDARDFLNKGEAILYNSSAKRNAWATWAPTDVKPPELKVGEKFEFGDPPLICIYHLNFAVFRSDDKKWKWDVDIYEKETGIRSKKRVSEEKLKGMKQISEEKPPEEDLERVADRVLGFLEEELFK